MLVTNVGSVPLNAAELPSDNDLPGLVSLLHPERLSVTLSRALGEWLGHGARLLETRAYLRRLFRGKRCSVEIELIVDRDNGRSCERRKLLGKFYDGDQGVTVRETLIALRRNGFREGRFLVTQPIAWLPEYRLLLLNWAEGTLFSSGLLAQSHAGLEIARAAEWLLHLHHCGITTGRRYSFEKHVSTLRQWKELLCQAYPRGERLLDALLIRIESRGSELAGWTARPTHRDFSPDHLVVEGDHLTCLDLDEFCHYDPLFDVAHFIAHLRFLSLTHFGTISQFDSLCDRFLGTYHSRCQDFSEKRLRLYLAISYFKLVRFVALVQRAEGWDNIMPEILSEAQRLAGRNCY
jgi:hypothetical protein